MKQKFYKSPVVWIAIFALIAFIIGNWGLYDCIGLSEKSLQELFNLILGVMIAFGIVNSPNVSDSFQ